MNPMFYKLSAMATSTTMDEEIQWISTYTFKSQTLEGEEKELAKGVIDVMLKIPNKLTAFESNLRNGIYIMLISNFLFHKLRDLDTRHLAIAISHTPRAPLDSWYNHSMVSGVVDRFSRVRSIFCIHPVIQYTNGYEEIFYGELVYFTINTTHGKLFLEAFKDPKDEVYKLHLTTVFNSMSYFRLLHQMQLQQPFMTDSVIPYRVAFLMQHELTKYFLTIDTNKYVTNIFGVEYAVYLKKLELTPDGIVPFEYYFRAYSSDI